MHCHWCYYGVNIKMRRSKVSPLVIEMTKRSEGRKLIVGYYLTLNIMWCNRSEFVTLDIQKINRYICFVFLRSIPPNVDLKEIVNTYIYNQF